MTHDAVICAIETVSDVKGDATGAVTREIKLKDEWASGKLRVVAFLQEQKSRRIVGAATGPLV